MPKSAMSVKEKVKAAEKKAKSMLPSNGDYSDVLDTGKLQKGIEKAKKKKGKK